MIKRENNFTSSHNILVELVDISINRRLESICKQCEKNNKGHEPDHNVYDLTTQIKYLIIETYDFIDKCNAKNNKLKSILPKWISDKDLSYIKCIFDKDSPHYPVSNFYLNKKTQNFIDNMRNGYTHYYDKNKLNEFTTSVFIDNLKNNNIKMYDLFNFCQRCVFYATMIKMITFNTNLNHNYECGKIFTIELTSEKNISKFTLKKHYQ